MVWTSLLTWILSVVAGSAFQVLKAPEGNFSSTGFPAFYPNGASDLWIINSGARVEVTFVAFDLQSCADCGCDYVEVSDGPFIFSPLIGRYCGSRTEPFTVVSSDEYLCVYFKTDSSISRRGFSAHYTSASKCPSLPRQLEGDVDNCHPKHRHTDKDCGELQEVFNEEQDCYWSGKTTAPLMRWEFEFLDDFYFKECPDCSCEYIEFFDGQNSSSNSLGRFCGSNPPDDLVTSGKYVSFTIKAGNTSKIHLKYKAKYSGGEYSTI